MKTLKLSMVEFSVKKGSLQISTGTDFQPFSYVLHSHQFYRISFHIDNKSLSFSDWFSKEKLCSLEMMWLHMVLSMVLLFTWSKRPRINLKICFSLSMISGRNRVINIILWTPSIFNCIQVCNLQWFDHLSLICLFDYSIICRIK